MQRNFKAMSTTELKDMLSSTVMRLNPSGNFIAGALLIPKQLGLSCQQAKKRNNSSLSYSRR